MGGNARRDHTSIYTNIIHFRLSLQRPWYELIKKTSLQGGRERRPETHHPNTKAVTEQTLRITKEVRL